MKPQAILLSLVAAFTLCIGSGCASFDKAFEVGISELTKTLDAKYADWKAKQEAAGETIGNDKPEAPIPPKPGTIAEDAVPYENLAWTYGGFNGANAYLGSPRISNLSVSSSNLSFTYDVDLSGWGLGHTDADALACLFCRVNGVWTGGKFEWISSSRKSRSLGNAQGGYNGWKGEDLINADAFAFVIVAKDQKRRSNVIMQEVKK